MERFGFTWMDWTWCLDSMDINLTYMCFWTGTDSVELNGPQVEWKCFPSSDWPDPTQVNRWHRLLWTNCPTVEHCARSSLIENNIYHTALIHCVLSTFTKWSRSSWRPFSFNRFQVALLAHVVWLSSRIPRSDNHKFSSYVDVAG